MPRNLRSTASDEIFNILRKEILSLQFLPGQELKINKLCDQLKVSRSPVRDAIIKLSADGLVDIYPQRGTQVSLIDLHLVEEEKFLRSSLEEKALIKAFTIITEKDITKYLEAIKDQEKEKNSTDYYDFFISDIAFHKITFDLIDKRECWKIIDKRCVNYDRVRFLSFKHKDDKEALIQQHYKIVEALKSKDEKKIKSILKTHLNKIDSEISALTEEYPNFFTLKGKPKKLSL